MRLHMCHSNVSGFRSCLRIGLIGPWLHDLGEGRLHPPRGQSCFVSFYQAASINHQASRPSRIARSKDSHSSSVRSIATTFLGSKVFGLGWPWNASMSNGSRQDRVSLTCSTWTVTQPPPRLNRPWPSTSMYRVANRSMSLSSAASNCNLTYSPPGWWSCAVRRSQFTFFSQPSRTAASTRSGYLTVRSVRPTSTLREASSSPMSSVAFLTRRASR